MCVTNKFLTAHRSYTKKSFEKNISEVGIPHSYASFGTFCAQTDQLFETQWIFEICLKIDKSPSSKENAVDFFWMFKDSLCC